MLSYQKRLIDLFVKKKARNAKFSLRAFAKQLGVSASTLSTVFRGRSHLNQGNLIKIANALDWSAADTKNYIDEVLSFQSSQRKLEMYRRHEPISYEKHELLERHHLWCYHLARLPENRATPAWLAKQTGLAAKETKVILRRLIGQGYLNVKDGRMIQTGQAIVFVEHPPSSAIQTFKSAVLGLGREALETVDDSRQKSLICHVVRFPRFVPVDFLVLCHS